MDLSKIKVIQRREADFLFDNTDRIRKKKGPGIFFSNLNKKGKKPVILFLSLQSRW